jgi:hypothetical protein
VTHFDRIQSVDSEKLLNVLNRTNWGPTGGRSAERLFPIVPTAGLLVEW